MGKARLGWVKLGWISSENATFLVIFSHCAWRTLMEGRGQSSPPKKVCLCHRHLDKVKQTRR